MFTVKKKQKNKKVYFAAALIILLLVILFVPGKRDKQTENNVTENNEQVSEIEHKDTSEDLQTRKIVYSALPEAPEWAEKENKYVLKLEADVDSSGNIKKISIKKSTGNNALDNYLITYIVNWKFSESSKEIETLSLTVNYEIN
jgi:TonB family protein